MKKIFLAVVILLVVFGGFYFYKDGSLYKAMNNSDVSVSKDDIVQNENIPSDSTLLEKTFTLADLSSHSSKDSCYSAVNGNVYDLTNWIDAHPGGEKAILSICGKDGSGAFSKKHGGQMKPEQELAKMKIGIISQ